MVCLSVTMADVQEDSERYIDITTIVIFVVYLDLKDAGTQYLKAIYGENN
jgi:hypothetical protein